MNRLQREKRQAEELWREFREEPNGRTRRIPVRWPKALTVIGHLELIAYTTTHGRKVTKYAHEFHPLSRPMICAGKEPGQAFLIGDRFKVTGRGFVDIDRYGRRLKHVPRLQILERSRR